MVCLDVPTDSTTTMRATVSGADKIAIIYKEQSDLLLRRRLARPKDLQRAHQSLENPRAAQAREFQ